MRQEHGVAPAQQIRLAQLADLPTSVKRKTTMPTKLARLIGI
jgi:hypothetical protein